MIIESEGYALGISFSSNGLSIVTDTRYRPRTTVFIGSENWSNINFGWTTSPPSAKLSLGEVGVSGSASTGKRVDINCWQTVVAMEGVKLLVGASIGGGIYLLHHPGIWPLLPKLRRLIEETT